MRRFPNGRSPDTCLRGVARCFFSSLFVGFFLIAPLPASAATYYVSPSGNDTNSGVSLTLAKKTIQAAINAAVAGDIVLVADGTYAPISINRAITVRSVNGAQTTIINGGGTARCAYLSSGALLDGFTVTNGYSSYSGGGIYAYGGTIENCIISGNSAYSYYSYTNNYYGYLYSYSYSSYSGYGGGVCAYNSTLRNCTITGNTAPSGGGIYTSGSTVDNCTISDNSAYYNYSYTDNYYGYLYSSIGYSGAGGGVYAGNSTLRNCTINRNMSQYGGGLYAYRSTIEECTISDNSAYSYFSDSDSYSGYSGYGGGAYAYNSTLQNCTINGNMSGYGGGIYYAYGGTIENCMISYNFAYSYYSYSYNGYSYSNYYGSGGGAYVSYYGTLRNCTINGNASRSAGGIYAYGSAVENCAIKENAAGQDGGGMYAYSSLIKDCHISGNTAERDGGGVSLRWGGTVTNCTISGNVAERNGGGVSDFSGKLQNCTISGNGAIWGGGVEVWWSSGMVENCLITENWGTYGGGGVLAVLDSTVQNCTINSNITIATEHPAYVPTYYSCGGGVLTWNGKVLNCLLSGNYSADYGGGIYAFGTRCKVQNCTLSENTTFFDGGGIYLRESTARNCLISGNTAFDYGGGVYTTNGTLENCTIVGNEADRNGGIYFNGGKVRNCIAYYNQNGDANGSISYSCVGTGTNITGVGNTFSEPQFISAGAGYGTNHVPGNYRLQPSSPCINAGINQSWMMTNALDLDGTTRLLNGIVDMGAYELNYDPGVLQFSPSSYSVNEDAGTVTLTVTRTRGSFGPASVDYTTADGTAVAGSDYTAQSGTLTWTDRDTSSKTITISIADDILGENDETFTVMLNNVIGAGLGAASLATVTIADNEPGEVQFSISSYNVNEAVGTVMLSVTRTGGSFGPASVEYTTADSTALAGSDYTMQSGTLSWTDGDSSTKTITVAITGDSLDENDETFTVKLSNAQGASLGPANMATATILDNDEPSAGLLQFTVTSVEIDEGSGSVSFTVTRTDGSYGAASVEYLTSAGTATVGLDYETVQGTLSWAEGDTSSKTISVPITEDSLDESDEAFTVTLSNAQGASLGPANVATVTILDNDEPPTEDLNKVDLEVSNFKFVPVNLWAGDNPAEIEFDLLNAGPGDLVTSGTQLEISFYLSVNQTLGDIDDIAIGTKIEVLSLTAGSQTTIRYPGRAHNTDVTIPEGLSGDYYVFVSIRLASSAGLYDPDGASAMREGPISVRIHPTGGGNDPGDGDNSGGGGSNKQRSVVNDYDGDGQTDLTSYDEASGGWAVQLSESQQTVQFVFGAPGYESVPGDYDGDSKADPAIHQRSGQAWSMLLSGQGYAAVNFNLGGVGETRGAVGDYLGKGQANPGLYEEQSGRWYVLTSAIGAKDSEIVSAVFGGLGYQPVVVDYDGDGKADPAVYAESTGEWLVMLSGQGYGMVSGIFGGPGYAPVIGDYDGDGKADPMLSTGSEWIGLMSGSGYALKRFSNLVGTPVPGDFDGDGTADPAVISVLGNWSFLSSLSAYVRQGPYSLTQ